MKTLPFKLSRKGSACTETFSCFDFTMDTGILVSLPPEFPDLVKCLQLGERLWPHRYLWYQTLFFIAFCEKTKIFSKKLNIQNCFFFFLIDRTD